MATVLNYSGSDAKKDADITTTVSEDTKSDIKDTGAPPLGAPIDKSGGIWRRGKPRLDLDSVARQLSVFDDPAGLETLQLQQIKDIKFQETRKVLYRYQMNS